MKNENLKILIEKAIGEEDAAYNFYIKLHDTLTDKNKKTKRTLLYIANQEKMHKEFLIGYIEGRYTMNSLKMHEIIDYRIAQHLDSPEPDKNTQFKDLYLDAVHRELDLSNFYKNLSEIQPYGIVKKTLMRMAEEELEHKKELDNLQRSEFGNGS